MAVHLPVVPGMLSDNPTCPQDIECGVRYSRVRHWERVLDADQKHLAR